MPRVEKVKSPESSNSTATMGFEADIGKEHADNFRNVQHPDLRAYIATRLSTKSNCEATLRTFCKAKDNSSQTRSLTTLLLPDARHIFMNTILPRVCREVAVIS